MVSLWVKDDTADSLTKGKRIAIPSTVIECPTMKIYSVRFYKNRKVMKDVIVSSEKELKRKVKLPKEKKSIEGVNGYDDVRVIVYSQVKDIAVNKKAPDLMEIAIQGSLDEKINFIKEKIGKEIFVSEVFKEGLVDVRAVTRGFGTQGPMDRFGIGLKDHKTEKGLRRPGSLGPWHPARVTFRTSQAGQHGYHSRMEYNKLIVKIGKTSEKDITPKGGFSHYGELKKDYMLLKGSIPGPKKRGLIITPSIKPSRIAAKQKFEVLEIR
jgi:large subunit ribosomal protein L3